MPVNASADDDCSYFTKLCEENLSVKPIIACEPSVAVVWVNFEINIETNHIHFWLSFGINKLMLL